MKIKFNKEKLIPNILDYLKIIVVVLVYFYIIKIPLFNLFPILNTLPKPLDDIILVIITLYIEELITLTWNGKKIYGIN